ncbi:MAG TPA: LysR substrate-binding domain-containing protein [Polyangiaceae bacterium]|jgi:DNA-binding transcriptional LysR family regulator
MDVDQLRAFVAVARARRFTKAARALGTTQPSLSRRVQQLEREVRAKLVVRTPAGVVLTSAGERFLAHAERALASVDAGRTAIDELSGQARGTVALGSQPTISAYVLPSLLERFHAKNPEVVLKLREGVADQIEERVASGELDLALMNLPVRRLDLAAQKLWQEDYLLAVPVGHRLASLGRVVSLADAVNEPLVVVSGAQATQALLAACEERGTRPHVVVDADNLEAVRRLVERGLGVALLPRTMAEATDSRRVRTLEVARGGVRRQIALVHRGEAFLTAAARALRATIVEVTAARRARPR